MDNDIQPVETNSNNSKNLPCEVPRKQWRQL